MPLDNMATHALAKKYRTFDCRDAVKAKSPLNRFQRLFKLCPAALKAYHKKHKWLNQEPSEPLPQDPKWLPTQGDYASISIHNALALDPAHVVSPRGPSAAERIPVEVVIMIFKQLGERADIGDIQSCSRVSKQWHQAGHMSHAYYRQTLFVGSYDSMIVGGWRYHGSTEYYENANFHLAHISTLTMLFDIELPFTGPLHTFRLPLALCVMTGLKTFSLRCRKPDPAFPIERQHLTLVVKALPPSLRQLDIDTKGNDCFSRPNATLCAAIGELIPQLTHLRLNLYFKCGHIFDEQTFRTRNMDNLRTLHVGCDDPLNRQYPEPAGSCCNVNSAFKTTVRETIVRAYLRHFPNAEEIVYFQTISPVQRKRYHLPKIGSEKTCKGHLTGCYPRYVSTFQIDPQQNSFCIPQNIGYGAIYRVCDARMDFAKLVRAAERRMRIGCTSIEGSMPWHTNRSNAMVFAPDSVFSQLEKPEHDLKVIRDGKELQICPPPAIDPLSYDHKIHRMF